MKPIVFLSFALVGLSSVVGWTNFSDNSSTAKSSYSIRSDRMLGEREPLAADAQVPVAKMSEKLSWVRGAVVSQSPGFLTLKLRDSSLTLSLDAETEIVIASNRAQSGGLAVGSVVQAHYLSRGGERRAVVIFDDAAAAQQLSQRAGNSYRGVVKTVRKGGVSIRIVGRTQGLSLDSQTVLVDRMGRQLAKGSKAITPLLSSGDSLLVTYSVYADFTYIGDTPIPNYWETALEIRKL